MRCQWPSIRAARRGSPSVSAARMAVEEKTSPPCATRSATVTSKPSSLPRACKSAAVPVRPLPKQKSAPITTWRMPSPSCSTCTAKSRAESCDSVLSNGSSYSRSTPSISNLCARACAFIRRNGAASGKKNSRGCGLECNDAQRRIAAARHVDHGAVAQMQPVEIAHGDRCATSAAVKTGPVVENLHLPSLGQMRPLVEFAAGGQHGGFALQHRHIPHPCSDNQGSRGVWHSRWSEP